MPRLVGVLLAAGRGSRFDPQGDADKLLAPCEGRPVVLAALEALAGAVDGVVAVVRPGARGERIADLLRPAGCRVVVCERADEGMGASLACGAAAAQALGPAGVLVMLGDMPFVRADTVRRVAQALRSPETIAAAVWRGRRGHPAAFGAVHLPALAALSGDRGAAALLASQPTEWVEAGDPGVLLDVDSPLDLRPGRLEGDPS